MDKKISNKFIYFFGSFGGILFGYDIGVMTGAMSQEAVFAIFGVICVLGVIFVKTRVPETQGKTLEQIEEQGLNR